MREKAEPLRQSLQYDATFQEAVITLVCAEEFLANFNIWTMLI